MENVEVIVEDFADRETLDSLGIESPWELLGLYVGVPLPEQSVFLHEHAPGKGLHLSPAGSSSRRT